VGYTNYWYTKPELKKAQFSSFAKDVKALLAKADVPLAFEYDQTDKPPQIDNEVVRFNGHGENGHETFMLTRKTEVSGYSSIKKMAFAFCKTARKPYDKYVTACLILAKKHFGKDIQVSSDGEMSDWQEGKKLAEQVVGKEIKFELENGE